MRSESRNSWRSPSDVADQHAHKDTTQVAQQQHEDASCATALKCVCERAPVAIAYASRRSFPRSTVKRGVSTRVRERRRAARGPQNASLFGIHFPDVI